MPAKDRLTRYNTSSAWLEARRNKWLEENGPCKKCGSNENLEIDHIDPSTKEYNISQIWSRDEETRNKELAKCQALCHDCHKEKTAKDMNYHIYIHGTTTMYNHGCRCDLCRDANMIKRRNYRQNRRKVEPNYH